MDEKMRELRNRRRPEITYFVLVRDSDGDLVAWVNENTAKEAEGRKLELAATTGYEKFTVGIRAVAATVASGVIEKCCEAEKRTRLKGAGVSSPRTTPRF
jgi:hypothetical protein